MEALFPGVYQWGLFLLTNTSPCLDCRVVKLGSFRSLFTKWRLKGVWKLFTVCANERIKAAWHGENSWWFKICFPVSRNTRELVCVCRKGPPEPTCLFFKKKIIYEWCISPAFSFGTCITVCVINFTIYHCGHDLVYTGNVWHPVKYWLAALIGTAGLS